MAEDIQSNIRINVDTAGALANIKNLQASLSAFYSQMAKSGAAANAVASGMQQNFINSVNMSGKFSASIENIKSSTESFNTALEKNKFSLAEYFKYGVAASKSFGKAFKTEYETINKVAVERVKDLQTQYIKMGRDANGALKAIAVRPLALDMQDLGTKTQIAAQRQQILNQLLKQGSTNLLNWGKNTQWAGRQLMVGFSIPIAMAGAAAAKAYQQIEEGSIKIKRVYGDMSTTAQETDAMVGKIKNLAAAYTQYGVAVSDTMTMAANAAAMGKTGADLLAQIDNATKLSVLGGVDQQQALDTTISLTNAFGLSTTQLADKINYLNAVENQTTLSIEDMTTAIPKAAPIVKQLGGNVEDLAFFLTAMKEGGINASEGANAIKSGMASLINPTKKASDFLKGFGIDVSGIVQKDKGDLKQTVLDFAKSLDTLDPLNRAKAIEMMFGKFQFARMSTMLQNVAKDGSQASKALELANMSAIQRAAMARKELDKIQSSPLYKFQKALADFQMKLAPVGEAFLKAITPVIGTVGKVLDWFNKLGEGSKGFIVKTIAVVGGLAPVILMTVGLVGNGIANIMKFLSWIKAAFNKATTASQVLGETTDYMTQEQLKAASVAASLDQIHSKLKQTFTSEAEAVTLYTNALKAANATASTFRGPVMPFRAGAKKMATGGLVVGPGGPTDDSVPTDLSNGEAVIDAATVKKNPRIISALFAGKKIQIPGYAKNNSENFRPISTYTNAIALHSGTANTNLNTGTASPAMLAGELRDSGGKILAPIIHEIALQLGAKSQAEVQDLLKKNPQIVGLAKNISTSLADELDTMAGTIGDHKYADMFKKHLDQNMTGLSSEIQQAANTVLTEITTIEDNTKLRIRSNGKPEAQGRIQSTAGKSSYRNKLESYISTAGTQFDTGTLPANPVLAHVTKTPQISSVAEFDKIFAGKNLTAQGQDLRRRLEEGVIEIYKQGTTGLVIKAPAEAVYNTQKSFKETVNEIYDQATLGIDQAADSHSPSLKAKKSGKNIADGAIEGLESQNQEAKAAGEKVAKSINGGVSQSRGAAGRATAAAYSRDPELRNLSIRRKNAQMMGAETAAIDQEIRARRNVIAASVKEKLAKEKLATTEVQEATAAVQSGIGKKAMTVGQGLDKLGGKFTKFGTGLTTASFALSMLPGSIGQIAQAITPVLGIISLLGSGFEFLNKKQMAYAAVTELNNLLKKAETTTLVESEAARVVELEEIVAENAARGIEVAETGVLAVLMGLLEAPIMPIVLGLTALVGVIALIVGGINAANDAAKKAATEKAARDNATGNSRKLGIGAMSELGTLTGVTPVLPASGEAKALGKNAKEANDIQTLLNSPEFSTKAGSDGKVSKTGQFINNISKMGARDAKSALSSYASDLKVAGFDDSSIDSIIKAIQIKAGKTSLKIKFKDVDVSSKTGRDNLAKNTANDFKKANDAQVNASKKYGAELKKQSTLEKQIAAARKTMNSKTASQTDKAHAAMSLYGVRGSGGMLKQLEDVNKKIGPVMQGVQSKIKSAANNASSNLQALTKALVDGKLKSGDFKSSMQGLADQIKTSSDQSGTLKQMFLNVGGGQDAINASAKLGDLNSKLALMAMLAANPVAANKVIADLNSGKAPLVASAQKTVASWSGGSGIASAGKDYQKTPPPPGSGTPGPDLKAPLKDMKAQAKAAAIGTAMLRNKSITVGFQQVLAGLDAKTLAYYGHVKNGIFVLNAHGKALKEAYSKKVIQDAINSVQTNIRNFHAQIGLQTTLKGLGYSIADAAKISADAMWQEAWASANTKKKRDQILAAIRQQIALQAEIDANQKMIDDAAAAQQAADQAAQDAANAAAEEAKKSQEEKNMEAAQKALDAASAELALAEANFHMAEKKAKIEQDQLALEEVARQEDVINKAYEERTKALDEIQKAQEAISQQQQDQLDVAAAITSGDMAAAARAVQQSRKNSAERAMQDQRNALETAHQRELDSIAVLVNGKMMTRKDLEADILGIEQDIYNFESSSGIQAIKDKIAQRQDEYDKAKALYDILVATNQLPPPNTGGGAGGGTPVPRVLYTYDPTKGQMVPDASATVHTVQVWKDSSGSYWDAQTGGNNVTGTNLPYYARGGFVSPFVAKGSDTVPAMLSPGEYVMKRGAVSKYGQGLMDRINSGTFESPSYPEYSPASTSITPISNNSISSNVDNSSVYNNSYSINITTTGSQDSDSIARTVISKIRDMDSQRIRGVRV